MKKITKISLSLLALIFVLIVAGVVTHSNMSVNTAFAQSSCGGCGDGGEGGGGEGGGGADPGCMDPAALNYYPQANIDDGSCKYPTPAPKCVSLAASKSQLPYGGGVTTLSWRTENAEMVKMKNVTTGAVSGELLKNNPTGKSYTVLSDTTFQLNVIGANGLRDTSCTVTVNVADPVLGCTDATATNYNPKANKSDDSCVYPTPAPKCVSLAASKSQLPYGGGVTTLSWRTENAEMVKMKNVTTGAVSGELLKNNPTGKSYTVLSDTTFQLNVIGANGLRDTSCTVTVNVADPVLGCTDATATNYNPKANKDNGSCTYPEPKQCQLQVVKSVSKTAVAAGEGLTYTITVKNTGDGVCTGGGVKVFDTLDDNFLYVSNTVSSNAAAGYIDLPVYSATNHIVRFNAFNLDPNESAKFTITGVAKKPTQCGDYQIKNQAQATAQELNDFKTWMYSGYVTTDVNYDCPVTKPAPICESFTASRNSVPYNGGDVTLRWDTTNATDVSITPTVGDVAADGSKTVLVTVPTTYTLTAKNSDNDPVSCTKKITVDERAAKPAPICESFTASRNSVPYNGGDVTLRWDTTNATNVTIYPTLGVVASDGSQSVGLTSPTKYLLTAKNADGSAITCDVTVGVDAKTPNPEPSVFSCAANVEFKAGDTSIDEGDATTLTWDVDGADSVLISRINASSFTGAQSVSPNRDTTYTLTATKGSKTIDCDLKIEVDEDNGGGGSSSGGGGGSSSPRCELEASDENIEAGELVTLTWETSRAREVTLTDSNGTTLFTTDVFLADDKEKYFDFSWKVKPSKDTTYTLTVERGSRDQECEVEIEVDDSIVVLETRDQKPLVASISLAEVPYTGFEAGTFVSFLFYMLLVLWALYITYVIIVRKQSAGGDIPAASSGVYNMKRAEAARPDLFPVSTAPSNLPIAEKKTTINQAPTRW